MGVYFREEIGLGRKMICLGLYSFMWGNKYINKFYFVWNLRIRNIKL